MRKVRERLTVTVDKEHRLRAMGEAIAAYEAEFGVMSDVELARQQRADREAAIMVRGHDPRGWTPR